MGGPVFGGNRSRRFDISQEGGGGRGDGGKEHNKGQRQNAADKGKKKHTAHNTLMKTLSSWTSNMLCTFMTVSLRLILRPKE